jgi:hypothetical protein
MHSWLVPLRSLPLGLVPFGLAVTMFGHFPKCARLPKTKSYTRAHIRVKNAQSKR